MPGAPDLAPAQPPGPLTRQAARRQPSARLWRMRRAEIIWAAAIVSAAVLPPAGLLAGPAAAGAAAAAVAGAACAALRVARSRFRSWSYTEREDDLIIERGVMFRRVSVIPYGRMQFVDTSAGPVERAFRLATVRLHTAAAASDARIPGLELAEAARLRDRLAALGEARAAGL